MESSVVDEGVFYNNLLRQLTVFETVARHLHFTRAAEELGTTQPSVSMQVKQLEDNGAPSKVRAPAPYS